MNLNFLDGCLGIVFFGKPRGVYALKALGVGPVMKLFLTVIHVMNVNPIKYLAQAGVCRY
jgi:hypothetical protein